MIHTRERLALFINDVLHRQDRCRVFSHVLFSCWRVPPEELQAVLTGFAAQHGWEVKMHAPAAYGIVADFQRVERGTYTKHLGAEQF
jgi:hypothetical protein